MRLPIRVRLTLAFAVVMAAVLAGMGFFVYARVAGALVTSVDQALNSRHERREVTRMRAATSSTPMSAEGRRSPSS